MQGVASVADDRHADEFRTKYQCSAENHPSTLGPRYGSADEVLHRLDYRLSPSLTGGFADNFQLRQGIRAGTNVLGGSPNHLYVELSFDVGFLGGFATIAATPGITYDLQIWSDRSFYIVFSAELGAGWLSNGHGTFFMQRGAIGVKYGWGNRYHFQFEPISGEAWLIGTTTQRAGFYTPTFDLGIDF